MREGLVLAAALALAGCTEHASTKDSTPPIPPSTQAADPSSFAVVELFTSEGCSSCPPADELAREIDEGARNAGRPVYVLAFHVDYWDELGWPDRFASPKWTARQHSYATAFDASGLYTPQVVIDGTTEMLGSDRANVSHAIADALGRPNDATITLSATPGDARVKIEFTVDGPTENALVRAALVERSLVSEISAGENAGKTIHHAPTVRALETVKAAPKGTISIDPSGVDRANARVVVFVQARAAPYAITAAGAVDLP